MTSPQRLRLYGAILLIPGILCFCCRAAAQTTSSLTLCCSASNDLVQVLTDSGIAFNRADTFDEAARSSPPGSGLLLLADDYPTTRTTPGTGTLELCRER